MSHITGGKPTEDDGIYVRREDLFEAIVDAKYNELHPSDPWLDVDELKERYRNKTTMELLELYVNICVVNMLKRGT